MKLTPHKLEKWATVWWKLHYPKNNRFWWIHPCDEKTKVSEPWGTRPCRCNTETVRVKVSVRPSINNMSNLSAGYTQFGTSAFYSRQLCLCPFPAYSVFSPATSFPSTKWSETCTTTLILLISVSFETAPPPRPRQIIVSLHSHSRYQRNGCSVAEG